MAAISPPAIFTPATAASGRLRRISRPRTGARWSAASPLTPTSSSRTSRSAGSAAIGLDYESLREENPRLVYCSITGFGQDGPYAQRPGYDFMIQGMGGIMDLTGDPHGEPQKIGVAYADIFTGRLCLGRDPRRAQAPRRNGRGLHISTWRSSTRRSACSPTRRWVISFRAQRRGASATRIRASSPTRCFRSLTGI